MGLEREFWGVEHQVPQKLATWRRSRCLLGHVGAVYAVGVRKTNTPVQKKIHGALYSPMCFTPWGEGSRQYRGQRGGGTLVFCCFHSPPLHPVCANPTRFSRDMYSIHFKGVIWLLQWCEWMWEKHRKWQITKKKCFFLHKAIEFDGKAFPLSLNCWRKIHFQTTTYLAVFHTKLNWLQFLFITSLK